MRIPVLNCVFALAMLFLAFSMFTSEETSRFSAVFAIAQ